MIKQMWSNGNNWGIYMKVTWELLVLFLQPFFKSEIILMLRVKIYI